MENNWITERFKKPEFGKPVLVYCRIYGMYIATFERIDDDLDYGNWHNGKELGVLPPLFWCSLPDKPKS